ncbi:MAG: T9SS type A sorting domain-containing protein [Flavobacteriales bacterium]
MKLSILIFTGLITTLDLCSQTQLYAPANMNPNSSLSAQDFETTYNAYDAQGADDFIVPTGDIWMVDSIILVGRYYCNSCTVDSVSGLNLGIYNDNNGEPGTLVYQQNTSTDVDFNGDGDLLAHFTTPIPLAAGHYWIVANARKDYIAGSGGGQWGWVRDTTQTFNSALWKNPGDGFASGCTSWVEFYNCTAINVTDSGFAFYMYGCINPPSLSLSAGDTSICAGEELTISATTDASQPVYVWNTGDSASSITISEAGVYQITVSDGIAGCKNNMSISVDVVDVPQPNIGADEAICEGASPALFLSSQPNYPNCRIVWPDGSDLGFYYTSTEGWIVLTFEDTIFGCSRSDSAYLTVHSSEATILPDSAIHFCAGDKVQLSTLEALSDVYWLRSTNGIIWSLLGQDSTINVSAGGFIAIEGITEFGCSATDTTFLTMHPIPSPSIAYTTLIDGTVQINVTQVDSGSTYKWSNGKKSKSIIVDENKTYSVSVTSIWGCVGVQSIVVSTVGVHSISSNSLRIYPSPAMDRINIEIPETHQSQPIVKISDVSGKIYHQQSYLSGPNVEISVSDLPNGIYVITLNSDNSIVRQGRFVINR